MAEMKSPNTMKGFLDKFSALFKKHQQEIPPKGMAEISRDYSDRIDK